MEISIIMGSLSDKKVADKVCQVLDQFHVDYEVKIFSAHRTPKALEEYMENCQGKVYIAIAGMAAHLAGVIASKTTRPVIGVPVASPPLEGMDALLSTVQMPKGIPVATVAINGGENAAHLAIQILAVADESLREQIQRVRDEAAQKVIETEYRN